MFRLMYLWNEYERYVESVTLDPVESALKDIGYWRNRIFKNFVLYTVPLSLVALVPAIPIGIMEGHAHLIIFDVAVALIITFTALHPRLNLSIKKGLVTFVFYLFAAAAIGTLGSSGPGVLYLLATTVFASLIFSSKFGYLFVTLHLVTCSVFAAVIQMHLFSSPLISQFTLTSWISFSLNLILLSLIFVLLISKTINGLENTILQELKLRSKLQLEADETANLHLKQKEAKGHYKSLFVQNPSPMWVVELETFRLLQVNDAAIESYGFSKAEFLNMTVMNLRFPSDSVSQHHSLVDYFQSGKRHKYVTQHQRKDKTIFNVEMRTNTIIAEGKQALLAIARDITEEKNYIKSIEEKNLKLQEVAYIQSHIVRAPLANIMGLVSLIKSNPDSQPTAELIDRLESSAIDLDRIIRRIADGTLSNDSKGLS
jgi:PAS domain S-box-containing protein